MSQAERLERVSMECFRTSKRIGQHPEGYAVRIEGDGWAETFSDRYLSVALVAAAEYMRRRERNASA